MSVSTSYTSGSVIVRPSSPASRYACTCSATSLGSPQEIAELLDRELAEGGCAVVIRNTVREAQETYEAVRSVFGREQSTLLHSRFLAAERAARDRRMLELFGKDSQQRPFRHVVVATQVIEQSLDVDFDLLDAPELAEALARLARRYTRAAGS